MSSRLRLSPRGWGGTTSLLAVTLLVAACATVTDSPPTRRYGMTFEDVRRALERGEGWQALAYYEREAARLEGRNRSRDAATAYAAATNMGWRIGAHQRALQSGNRALQILGESPSWTRAATYSDLGLAYSYAGDIREARRLFEDGLALATRLGAYGSLRFWSALFLQQLADLDNSEGNYQAALERADKARDLVNSQLSQLTNRLTQEDETTFNRRLLYIELAIGRSQARLGNQRAAERSFRDAVGIARMLQQRDAQMHALQSLGSLYLAGEDYGKAAKQYEAALVIAIRQDHAARASISAGLGEAYAGQGRLEEASTLFQNSVELIEQVRGSLREVDLRRRFLDYQQKIYHGIVRVMLAIGRIDDAFNYAERARSRAFLDVLGSKTTLSKGKTRALITEEAALRSRLAEAQASLSGSAEFPSSAAARQQFEAVEREYRAFLDRVRHENAEQASLMSVEPMTVREVQEVLPDGTTLMEYLVTERETYLWIISRADIRIVRLPVSRSTLVQEVEAFRRATNRQDPLEVIHERARRLFDQLLEPAMPDLRADHLLIVPHDVLHYLHFAALRSPEGRWVVEKYTLSTLPSASVLKYLDGRTQDVNRRVLALGNPDLGPAMTLRYAEREAQAVGELLSGVTILIRGDATEHRVKALSADMGLLHFAAHAELSEDDPLSSAILLVPGDGEDGRLEVREVLMLDLRASLVVLSACETALGRLSRGDELVGFQRAFLYAGTPAIVTTLWKVDDQASYLLMREFYARLEEQGPAVALREAQRTILKSFPHPFAWAGFNLTAGVR